MSGFIAIMGPDAGHTSEAVATTMLGAMSRRGVGDVGVHRGDGIFLAVQRPRWQQADDLAGAAVVTRQDQVAAVADAAIFYRADLHTRLGLDADGRRQLASPTDHILAAYRSFGPGCVRVLEGEFAFALWDAATQQLLIGRDHSGIRPLFVARFGGLTVVASTIGAVRAHPECPQDLDRVTLAADAAGLLFATEGGTAFSAIKSCLAGTTMLFGPGSHARTDRFWPPAGMAPQRARSFDDAADELRSILSRAVDERMPAATHSAVWMSGGYDSPSIAAVASLHAGAQDRLVSVCSASFPVGHSAREDELILEIADRLGVPINWIHPADEQPESLHADGYDAPADEPFRHIYPLFIHALSARTAAAGARVALTGHAGDFLFQCSLSYFSDLLRTGHLFELASELRAIPGSGIGFREFVKYGVEPNLPDAVLSTIGRLRGKVLTREFERRIPSWVSLSSEDRDALEALVERSVPVRGMSDQAAAEFLWYQTNHGFVRLAAGIYEVPLSHGVELRSPFHDARVIAFAAAGPRSERFRRGETKRLLRRAMAPLLPESAVRPRQARTGTLMTTLDGMLYREQHRLRSLFDAGDCQLDALGLVDASQLRTALDRMASRGADAIEAEQVYRAGIVETWLRRAADRGALRSGVERVASV